MRSIRCGTSAKVNHKNQKNPENPTGEIKYNAKNYVIYPEEKGRKRNNRGTKNRRDKWMININSAYEYLMSVSNGLSIPIKGQR